MSGFRAIYRRIAAAFDSAPLRIVRFLIPRLRRFVAPFLSAAALFFAASPAMAQTAAQNSVGMFGTGSGEMEFRLTSPAPDGGIRVTVAVTCEDDPGVRLRGDNVAGADDRGTERNNFTVARGDDLSTADDDEILDCARFWRVDIAGGETAAAVDLWIGGRQAGRLVEFFLVDPRRSEGAWRVDDGARHLTAARGLEASFAAGGAVAVAEGSSISVTVSFSGTVGFSNAAASVAVAQGGDAETGDYQIGGLASGGGLAAAVDAEEAVFMVTAADDGEVEPFVGNAIPVERFMLALTDARASGFAVGDSNFLTVLIAEGGDHSPIAFDATAAVAATEGDTVTMPLSFNTLPAAFSVTLALAAEENRNKLGEFEFPSDGGCEQRLADNSLANRRCVILVPENAGTAEAKIKIIDDGDAEVVVILPMHLAGDAPPGYVFGTGAQITISVAASDVNALSGSAQQSKLIELARTSGTDDGAQMQEFIDAGADVNIRNSSGDTAIHWAVFYAHPGEVAALLGAEGIHINEININRQTPLDFAYGGRGNGAFFRMLRERGFQCNLNCRSGDTQLDGTVP